MLSKINVMVPPQTDIASVYATASDNDQGSSSPLCCSDVDRNDPEHRPLLDIVPLGSFTLGGAAGQRGGAPECVRRDLAELSLIAARHLYLVKISQVEEREVFKMYVARKSTENDRAAASSTGRGW